MGRGTKGEKGRESKRNGGGSKGGDKEKRRRECRNRKPPPILTPQLAFSRNMPACHGSHPREVTSFTLAP